MRRLDRAKGSRAVDPRGQAAQRGQAAPSRPNPDSPSDAEAAAAIAHSRAQSRIAWPRRAKDWSAAAQGAPRHACKSRRPSETQRRRLEEARPNAQSRSRLARRETRRLRESPRRAEAPGSQKGPGPAIATFRSQAHSQSAPPRRGRGSCEAAPGDPRRAGRCLPERAPRVARRTRHRPSQGAANDAPRRPQAGRPGTPHTTEPHPWRELPRSKEARQTEQTRSPLSSPAGERDPRDRPTRAPSLREAVARPWPARIAHSTPATRSASKVRSAGHCRSAIQPRALRRKRLCAKPSRNLRPRGSRIGAVRVSGEEGAPSCERGELPGDRVVQLFVGGRRHGRRRLGLAGRRILSGIVGDAILEVERPENIRANRHP